MGQTEVCRVGDPNFVAVKQDYTQLHIRFPLPDEVEADFLMLAFDKTAAKIVAAICREHPTVTTDELWNLFGNRLSNATQRRSQNTSFPTLNWEEKNESVEKFWERVQALGVSLDVSQDLVQAKLLQGLQSRLQLFARNNRGRYDELVSSIQHISTTLKKFEFVRETQETIYELKLYKATKPDSSGVLVQRNSMKPTRRSSANPVDRRTDKLDDIQNRYAIMKCYECKEYGYLP